MQNHDKSPHILNASSNLVGFCFVILSSIKILNLGDKTLIDNITIFSFISFMGSSLFSFLSIRNKSEKRGYLETIAEYSFLSGLILVFITAMLIAINII